MALPDIKTKVKTPGVDSRFCDSLSWWNDNLKYNTSDIERLKKIQNIYGGNGFIRNNGSQSYDKFILVSDEDSEEGIGEYYLKIRNSIVVGDFVLDSDDFYETQIKSLSESWEMTGHYALFATVAYDRTEDSSPEESMSGLSVPSYKTNETAHFWYSLLPLENESRSNLDSFFSGLTLAKLGGGHPSYTRPIQMYRSGKNDAIFSLTEEDVEEYNKEVPGVQVKKFYSCCLGDLYIRDVDDVNLYPIVGKGIVMSPFGIGDSCDGQFMGGTEYSMSGITTINNDSGEYIYADEQELSPVSKKYVAMNLDFNSTHLHVLENVDRINNTVVYNGGIRTTYRTNIASNILKANYGINENGIYYESNVTNSGTSSYRKSTIGSTFLGLKEGTTENNAKTKIELTSEGVTFYNHGGTTGADAAAKIGFDSSFPSQNVFKITGNGSSDSLTGIKLNATLTETSSDLQIGGNLISACVPQAILFITYNGQTFSPRLMKGSSIEVISATGSHDFSVWADVTEEIESYLENEENMLTGSCLLLSSNGKGAHAALSISDLASPSSPANGDTLVLFVLSNM